MGKKRWASPALGWLLVSVSVLAAAGCSGSSDDGTSQSKVTGAAADEAVTAAKEVVAPYVGQPGPFPVTEQLNEMPRGSTIAFMDCGLPYCALFWELIQQPADMLGLDLQRIDTGLTADTVSSAFDSVVTLEPDGVIVMANNIQLWSDQLRELQELNIPVVTQGVSDAEENGIVSPQGSDNQIAALARLEANYIPAEMDPEANVVYYEIPELSFTVESADKFVDELEAACPNCSVRRAKIGAATIGKTSSNAIVSDLQANPDTNLAVFSAPDLAVGLPPSLETAGIDVQLLNTAPIPANLQQIKDGDETVGLGSDTSVTAWVLIDVMARQLIGQEVTGPEAEGVQVMQFLRQGDIDFDPSSGWTGYPDFADRFAELWGVPVAG